jgi:FixJ family two-component response regulator
MTSATTMTKSMVFIVDDDVSVRESLESLITEAGWRPKPFDSAGAFLAHQREAVPSCVVLDVGLPDLNGLELQQRIASGPVLPVIIITGRGDIPMTVKAMKAGAVEFLTKPFSSKALLDAIQAALERSSDSLALEQDLRGLHNRYDTLSARERQVMALVVRGHLNKQVAFELSLSEITVKVHRGRLMRKLGAESLAELVTMAARLGVPTAR